MKQPLTNEELRILCDTWYEADESTQEEEMRAVIAKYHELRPVVNSYSDEDLLRAADAFYDFEGGFADSMRAALGSLRTVRYSNQQLEDAGAVFMASFYHPGGDAGAMRAALARLEGR